VVPVRQLVSKYYIVLLGGNRLNFYDPTLPRLAKTIENKYPDRSIFNQNSTVMTLISIQINISDLSHHEVYIMILNFIKLSLLSFPKTVVIYQPLEENELPQQKKPQDEL